MLITVRSAISVLMFKGDGSDLQLDLKVILC